MNPTEFKLYEASSNEDYSKAADLFREYASVIGIDLGFQNFQDELQSIEEQYSSPKGLLILVKNNTLEVACAGVRAFNGDICELKRMYVRGVARGYGLGRIMLRQCMQRAAELGYRKMRLDTLPNMADAIHLYETEGFYAIEPYRYNPITGTKYYEKVL